MRLMNLYPLCELVNASSTASNLFVRLFATSLKGFSGKFSDSGPFIEMWSAVNDAAKRYSSYCSTSGFGILNTMIDGNHVEVQEEVIWEKPFCRLVHFKKNSAAKGISLSEVPKVLVVAPMSGFGASLLNDLLIGLLPHHDVYITDWKNARDIPTSEGKFDLSSQIDYIMSILRVIDCGVHVVAVHQAVVPVLATVSILSANNDLHLPSSMILVGGPVDVQAAESSLATFIQESGLNWFERNMVTEVPQYYRGHTRLIVPGCSQFYGMTLYSVEEHVNLYQKMITSCISGEDSWVSSYQKLYDGYLRFMDLTAEFYLQSLDTVFIKRLLPAGRLEYRNQLVDPSAISSTALMTIAGEFDRITPPMQTQAAHKLCCNLPDSMQSTHLQAGVGHYGILCAPVLESDVIASIRSFISQHRARTKYLTSTKSAKEDEKNHKSNKSSPQKRPQQVG